MAFFIYNYSENAENDVGLKYSLSLNCAYLSCSTCSVFLYFVSGDFVMWHSANCDRCFTTRSPYLKVLV